MFGLFKSKASKPTNNTPEIKRDKKHSVDKSSMEPGSGFSPAQASLISSFTKILTTLEEGVSEWDPASISDEEFVDVIKELMRFIAARIDTHGEISYVAKKGSKFLTEMLHGALRRDRRMSEVPAVHATLIDDMYSAIDAVRTGLHEDADVSALDEEYRKDQKSILRQAQRKAGHNIIIP